MIVILHIFYLLLFQWLDVCKTVNAWQTNRNKINGSDEALYGSKNDVSQSLFSKWPRVRIVPRSYVCVLCMISVKNMLMAYLSNVIRRFAIIYSYTGIIKLFLSFVAFARVLNHCISQQQTKRVL